MAAKRTSGLKTPAQRAAATKSRQVARPAQGINSLIPTTGYGVGYGPNAPAAKKK